MEIVPYTINKAKTVKNRERKNKGMIMFSVINTKKISRNNKDDTCAILVAGELSILVYGNTDGLKGK